MTSANPHVPPIGPPDGCGLEPGNPKAPVGEPGGYRPPTPPTDTPDGRPKPPRIEEPKSPHVDPAHPPKIEEPPRPHVDPPATPSR
jgi:hypothetical protein